MFSQIYEEICRRMQKNMVYSVHTNETEKRKITTYFSQKYSFYRKKLFKTQKNTETLEKYEIPKNFKVQKNSKMPKNFKI